MPVYKCPPTRFHFIHIPRTAGRFIEAVIKDNGFQLEHNTLGYIEGVDIIHLHKELYEKYLDVKDMPHIAVIRNPIDKFFSASPFLKRMYGDDIQEQMEDPMMFSMMLQNFPLTQAVNWFRPQSDFLTEDTHIWRFENGFNKNFSYWLSDITGVKTIKIDRKVPYDTSPLDRENKLKRTPALMKNIRQLYKREIDQYYPELNNRKNIYPVVRNYYP